MRRKERAVTDRDKIREIVNACYCCRLGFHDNGKVYIVPLSFGYEEQDDRRTFYFHGELEGRKIDLIRQTHYVGFELDTNYHLIESDAPCCFSANFQSVIGTGQIELLECIEEKAHALQCIMHHSTSKNDWNFPTAMLENVAVFKLEVDELSYKEHQTM